jgi:hypothetical protein
MTIVIDTARNLQSFACSPSILANRALWCLFLRSLQVRRKVRIFIFIWPFKLSIVYGQLSLKAVLLRIQLGTHEKPTPKSPRGIDCIELSKALSKSQIPKSCDAYLKIVEEQTLAWAGASHDDKVSAIQNKAAGSDHPAILQRRYTQPAGYKWSSAMGRTE